jgi:predicted nucleic acid-binding protein
VSYLIVDTDVSSKILRDRLPASLETKLLGKILCVTFVTLAELTQWAEIRHWGQRSRRALDRWLEPIPILPDSESRADGVLEDVARVWGEISARAKLRHRPRPQNDTWIAACCLVYDLPLATLNVKDFEDFAQHEGLTIVSA